MATCGIAAAVMMMATVLLNDGAQAAPAGRGYPADPAPFLGDPRSPSSSPNFAAEQEETDWSPNYLSGRRRNWLLLASVPTAVRAKAAATAEATDMASDMATANALAKAKAMATATTMATAKAKAMAKAMATEMASDMATAIAKAKAMATATTMATAKAKAMAKAMATDMASDMATANAIAKANAMAKAMATATATANGGLVRVPRSSQEGGSPDKSIQILRMIASLDELYRTINGTLRRRQIALMPRANGRNSAKKNKAVPAAEGVLRLTTAPPMETGGTASRASTDHALPGLTGRSSKKSVPPPKKSNKRVCFWKYCSQN